MVAKQTSETISVIVPAYNEAGVIGPFYQRLRSVLDARPERFLILFVDDGSTDGTAEELGSLRAKDDRVAVVTLSRNFGKEIAITAGLDHVSGDAAIFIDADLQDPPEVIPQLIEKWHEGYDVVYAQRRSRLGDSWLKRATARCFYGLMRNVGERVQIPRDTGDFRLMNRLSLDAIKRLREQHRFMKGLFAWVGFKQAAVLYDRQPRVANRSKWTYWRLWNLSIEGLTSFTTAPLRLATYLGLLVGFLSFAYALVVIYKTLVHGDPVAGYPSLMTVVLFLGGVQLVAIGIIGEYLGRIFNETKSRPLYLVRDYQPSSQTAGSPVRPSGQSSPDSAE